VWRSLVSSAPGKRGVTTGENADLLTHEKAATEAARRLRPEVRIDARRNSG
jgi:hypothetical protein